MKRHGNLYPQIVQYDNIILAYEKARKGKRWQDTIKRFEKHLEDNILKIQEALINKTFTTSPYTMMTIHEPKKRIIYKLPFNPDRIVHHALMNILEQIWSGLFLSDSYACRRGYGLHAASRRTMEHIRTVGRNGYCLKLDISKFYPSVDHDIMFDIVQRKIKCKGTLWLLANIIYSIPGGKNVPIGNYTSQWLGNLYLNELDQYLKHEYHIKNYVRYCDDFLILHNDKGFLNVIAHVITEFVQNRLDMKLSKCDLFPIKRGIDFVGYRHFPEYVLLRKSTALRIKKRLKKLPLEFKSGIITSEQYRSILASIRGWLRWANTNNLQLNMGLKNA